MIAYLGGIALVGAVGSGAVALHAFEHRQLYKPSRRLIEKPSDRRLAYEDVRFQSSDGIRLHGWYLPAASTEAPVILSCHGQGGNISDRLDKAELWHRLGAGVFLFDYRGYGESGGEPEEEGLYLDGQAAYAWLRERMPARRIVFYGASLGGGVATRLAADNPAGGLILEDTFTSVADMAHETFSSEVLGWFVRDRFDNLKRLPGIAMPVLIFHSRADEVVPFAMGRRLFAAAKNPKEFVELSGSHDVAYSDSGERYTRPLSKFLFRT